MTNEQIEKFFSSVKLNSLIRVTFKRRSSVLGVFIQTPDINELKSKNFWRVVSQDNFEQWSKNKDYNLCHLFNGQEFVKLSLA